MDQDRVYTYPMMLLAIRYHCVGKFGSFGRRRPRSVPVEKTMVSPDFIEVMEPDWSANGFTKEGYLGNLEMEVFDFSSLKLVQSSDEEGDGDGSSESSLVSTL